MINELLLLIHILCISGMAFFSLKMGKEGLVSFTVITIMLANLFVQKHIVLFSLGATSADALAVGSLLGFNLLQEFYGRALARRTIFITFCMLGMYVLLSQIQLWYVPSAFDQTHVSFQVVLSKAPWLGGCSMIIWVITQMIDFISFGVLQKLWYERFLLLRNYIAIGISQVVDTLLFTSVLFWLGIIDNVLHVFVISLSIKWVIMLLATPLVTLFASRYQNYT